jgi:hypothetical protein
MNENHIYSIKEAIEDNFFCALPEFIPAGQLPNWSDLINAVNEAAHKPADFHVKDPFVETQVNFTIRRGIGYFHSFFDNSSVQINSKLAPVLQELKDNGLEFFGNSIFLNLFTEDDYARPHGDGLGNYIYIQCEGSASWMLYKNADSEDPFDTVVLSPGDAICFTGDVYHAVTANSPRASIVLRMTREA